MSWKRVINIKVINDITHSYFYTDKFPLWLESISHWTSEGLAMSATVKSTFPISVTVLSMAKQRHACLLNRQRRRNSELCHLRLQGSCGCSQTWACAYLLLTWVMAFGNGRYDTAWQSPGMGRDNMAEVLNTPLAWQPSVSISIPVKREPAP